MCVDVVILSAGRGSRLGGNNNNLSKSLLKINGKTIFQLIIEKAHKALPSARINVVITPYMVNPFSFEIQRIKMENRIKIVIQKEPKGTLEAVCLTQTSQDSGLCVVLGDCIVKDEIFFQCIATSLNCGHIGCAPVNKGSYSSTVIETHDNRVVKILKGTKDQRGLRWTGRIYFPSSCELKREIICGNAFQKTPFSNGEKNISKYLQMAMTAEFNFICEKENDFVNINSPKDYQRAIKMMK